MNLLESIKETNFKGVILIGKRQRKLFESAFGYADFEAKKLNYVNTVFRIASITKQFTAIAILKLYEEKKIDLHDPISKYLEGVTKGDVITFHHILSNSSGIQNFSLDLDFDSLIDEKNVLESVINIVKDKPLMFEPGEKFSYSVSGYLILQYVIEKVSSLDYESYLKENFFIPLKMEDTGLETPDKEVLDMAIPYKEENVLARPFDMRIAGGGGGLYSSLPDLYKWFLALTRKKILKRRTHDLMFQKHIKADKVNSYGYGMILAEKDDYLRYYHSGGGFGAIKQFN